jgi:hypothetical protein
VFEARSHGFDDVRRTLEERGWTFVSGPGGAAPVLASGRLPTGEAFSFRCRWDSCRLDVRVGVDPDSDELIREPDWSGNWARDGWETFDASWAEPADVLDALTELEARYRAES